MEPFPSLPIRPYQLLCTVCLIGGGGAAGAKRPAEILRGVRARPDAPMTLRCHADMAYRYQNPGRSEDSPWGELFNDKRDLDVLQRIGLVPGATRPARELFRRVFDAIPTVRGICGYDRATSEAWRGCPDADAGHYEKGHALGIGAVIPRRPEEEKRRAKAESARTVLEAGILRIRPHHLLCMACFHAGRTDPAPIAEDNLWEALEAIRRNPLLPVTLIRGCCMICPPCSRYEPSSERCVCDKAMALRDQKKDLDVLQILGLSYGDSLSARGLYTRLFREVPSTTRICGYGDGIERGWEWSVCGGPDGSEGYRKARAAGLGLA